MYGNDPIWPTVVLLLDLIGLVIVFIVCLGVVL